jgi:hypothetical protein
VYPYKKGRVFTLPLFLSFCEKGFDFSLSGLHSALLEDRLAAAPAIEGLGHFLAQLTEITVSCHQTEGIACFLAAAEDRSGFQRQRRSRLCLLPGHKRR